MENIKNFTDAIKHYYSLGYEDRILFSPSLIELASTVKDLIYVLNLVGNKYRTQIVKKMQEIAISDEEKRIAYSYKI